MNSWKPKVLFLILLLGLVLRLLYLGHLVETPYFKTPVLDELYHDNWARRLAAGGWVGRETLFRAPLYPYLLGMTYAVFGPDYYIPRLLGLLLGVATLYLIYRIGQLAFGPTVGLIAAGLAMGYRTLIYFEGELLITGLLVFLVYLTLFWILKTSGLLLAPAAPGPDSESERGITPKTLFLSLLAVGLCLGLTAIARPNVLLFVPFLLVWFGYFLSRRGGCFWRDQTPQLGFVLGIALMVLPVTLYNRLAGKDWVLISSQAGINFHIGNNPEADGFTSETPEYYNFYGEYQDSVALFARSKAEEVLGHQLKPSEVSRYWFREGLKFWTQHPGAAGKLFVKKLYLFWSNTEVRNNKNLYFMRRYSWVQRIPWLNFALVAALGFGGIGAYFYQWRRKPAEAGPGSNQEPLTAMPIVLVAFILLYALSVVLFFVCARYRQPIIPSLLIFAAYGLTWAWKRRERKTPVAVFAVVVLMLVFALTRNPYGLRMDDFAEDHWSVANCYQEQGEFAKAEEHYKQSLQLRPDFIEAHLNLGNCYYRTGKKVAAAEAYSQVLRLEPRHPKALNNLGRCLLEQGEYGQAEPLLRRALAEEPDNTFARNNLGEVLLGLGRGGEAFGEFQRAVDIFPGNTTAWKHLGELYQNRGEFQKAQECFQKAGGIESADKP